jgi:hypothetical protein
MNMQSLLNRLEACVQEEIQARERTHELLVRQERAILDNRSQELAEATREIERELLCGVMRGARRAAVLAALEKHWGVPASAMTLGSIAERAGPGAERLLRLRADLRERSARVARQNRRVAALTRLHRRLIQDVLGALFQEESGAAPLAAAGTLVDAEA